VVTIIGLVQFPGISPIYPATNTTDVSPEKDSTLSITNTSQPNDNEIGKTFIIYNPPLLNNSINNITESHDSKALLTNENTYNNTNLNNNKTLHSNDFSSNVKQLNDKNTSTNLDHKNELQRGEYKVDSNGIHFYNINNCSMAKGSSGIGNLSECEDAEKEMKEE
jgi:hypothetical protein